VQPIVQKPLGRTGLMVSPIALGGASFAYVQKSAAWDPTEEAGRQIVFDTINCCLDSGINYIDTAAYYGAGYSEELIGQVMQRRRSECVLASKVWFESTYQEAVDSIKASCRRLCTDHIDIMQIHGRWYDAHDVDRIVNGGLLQALRDMQAAGVIGHIGITAEESYSLLGFLSVPDITVYQIAYNIIYQGAALHFLDKAREAGVGVVTMRSMTSGIFQRQMEMLRWEGRDSGDLSALALRFVHSDSRVHSAIVGMRWPHEVEQNLAVLRECPSSIDLADTPRTTVGVYKATDDDVAAQGRLSVGIAELR
jgi:aryl-alcohol dehydrogenase-like predicted oxidoreductase